MEILRDVFLFVHFVGLASLLGGAFVQMKGPKRFINPAMFHGALTQLITGVALVGINEMRPDVEVNHMKVGIKTLIMVIILVMVLMQRKKENVPAGAFFGIFGLTLLNVAIAVFV